jgi:hypothetical protein
VTAALRHRCRNQHCRLKLKAPVENHHRAFCCRGCYERFHHDRCRVCEADLRKQGRRGDAGRLYCRPPKGCKAEAQKWPEKYAYGPGAAFTTTNVKSAHSTGPLYGIAGHRPKHHCLRDWWWGDPGIGDFSLYDAEGLTRARIVHGEDRRWHLRTPIAIPRQSWGDPEPAKRRAEGFALMAIPLADVDPKLAARIKRDNSIPHPMGPPLNRQPSRETATASDWKPTGNGADAPGIPELLRRRP